jgi:hypothetical protein
VAGNLERNGRSVASSIVGLLRRSVWVRQSGSWHQVRQQPGALLIGQREKVIGCQEGQRRRDLVPLGAPQLQSSLDGARLRLVCLYTVDKNVVLNLCAVELVSMRVHVLAAHEAHLVVRERGRHQGT